jgi:hypothetical protein
MNKEIKHQFLNKKCFLPTWEVDTLVLGTFNPECGEKTDYFYGRSRNRFWKVIAELMNKSNNYFTDDFDKKLECMKQNRFGCTDVISEVLLKPNVTKEMFCGNGYADSVLFTQKKCTISYEFESIKHCIKKHKVKTVLHTWGKRKNPKQFRLLVEDLMQFCSDNKIEFIENCPSPSARNTGAEVKMILKNLYQSKLINS